jgi:hypothetical protein
MYPTGLRLPSNPITSQELFQFAMTDERDVGCCVIRWSVSLMLLQGKTEFWDVLYYQNQAISLVKKNLRVSGSEIEHTTIGALLSWHWER